MAQAVLAGPDGRSPAIDQLTGQPLTMEELLRRRGILAIGGNSRPMPFANDPTGSATTATAATLAGTKAAPTMKDVAATVANSTDPSVAAGASPVPGLSKKTLDGMSDEEIDDLATNLAPIIGAGAVAGLANYLLTRKRGGGGAAAGAADATSATAENNAAIGQRQIGSSTAKQADIIDGEFEVVHPNKSLPNQGAMKQLGAPDVVDVSKPKAVNRSAIAGALEDNMTRVKPNTRKEIGARQSVQSRTQPPGSGVIQLGDSYDDLTDTEFRQAITLRDQLIADHVAGRRSKVKGRAGKPTADINPEGVFNEIVRLIREGRNAKAVRGLSRVK